MLQQLVARCVLCVAENLVACNMQATKLLSVLGPLQLKISNDRTLAVTPAHLCNVLNVELN